MSTASLSTRLEAISASERMSSANAPLPPTSVAAAAARARPKKTSRGIAACASPFPLLGFAAHAANIRAHTGRVRCRWKAEDLTMERTASSATHPPLIATRIGFRSSPESPAGSAAHALSLIKHGLACFRDSFPQPICIDTQHPGHPFTRGDPVSPRTPPRHCARADTRPGTRARPSLQTARS